MTNQKAWSDLEVPLRDLAYMAGIARDIAYELLDLEVTRRAMRTVDDEVAIRMSEREYEQFFLQSRMSTTELRPLRGFTSSDRSKEQTARGRLRPPFCCAACDPGHGATARQLHQI
jgi:hypothetical protein